MFNFLEMPPFRLTGIWIADAHAKSDYSTLPVKIIQCVYALCFCICTSAHAHLFLAVDTGRNVVIQDYITFHCISDLNYLYLSFTVSGGGRLCWSGTNKSNMDNNFNNKKYQELYNKYKLVYTNNIVNGIENKTLAKIQLEVIQLWKDKIRKDAKEGVNIKVFECEIMKLNSLLEKKRKGGIASFFPKSQR